MLSDFLEGVGLIKVGDSSKNNIGIWFSSTVNCSNRNIYVRLFDSQQQLTFKELEWSYPNESIEMYKYSDCKNEESIRLLLCQEMINNTSLSDLYKRVLDVFTADCENTDVVRINNYLNQEEENNDNNPDDPVLVKLEERVSKITNKSCDKSIHDNDELFKKLINCGFEKIDYNE